MNRETDCPVCHKPLQSGQDIVTCPECGAAYHRECYLKEGRCLFANKHANGFEYHPPKTESAAPAYKNEGGVLCPQCKTVNDAAGIFCENCGAPLHGTAKNTAAFMETDTARGASPFTGGGAGAFASPFSFTGYGPQQEFKGEIDGIPANDWAQFIGSSAPVYLARLFGMQRSKRRFSFMLSAFLFSPTYFAYRKMWGWAAISFAATIVLLVPQMMLIAINGGLQVPFSLTASTVATLANIAYYLDIAMRVAFGFTALLLFRRFAAKRMRHLRLSADDATYQEQLVQKGGVSVVGVVLVVVLMMALSGLLSYFMGDALIEYFRAMGLFF